MQADTKKNYRPVNNLVFFSKLIERIVKKRFNKDVAENALQSHSQFGYKTHHSTETMMIGLVDEVLMEWNLITTNVP